MSLGTSSQSTSLQYSPLARALCSNAPRRFHHPPPAATATLGLRTEAHSLTLLRLRVTRLGGGGVAEMGAQVVCQLPAQFSWVPAAFQRGDGGGWGSG